MVQVMKMASKYGMITVAELEGFASHDYSDIDAAYTDDVIEAKITAAEQIVNAYRTINLNDDSQIVAVKMLASKMMFNQMVDDNHSDKDKVAIVDTTITNLLGTGDSGGSDLEFEWM